MARSPNSTTRTASTTGGSALETPGGIPLARLLHALDAAVTAGDVDESVTIAAVGMLDSDDVRLGVRATDRALVLFVGVADDEIGDWLIRRGAASTAAIMVKDPSAVLLRTAAGVGVAVVSIDPNARWEHIYNLVTRVLEAGHAADFAGPRGGYGDDLFVLATEIARRTHGLVSIEDVRTHLLAYSGVGDEADDLRRLTILGREAPPEMLAALRRWGVMDDLRSSVEVVAIDARAELGLRARRAVAIRAGGVVEGEMLGIVWVQQGTQPLAPDTDQVLIGAAAVAARIISRRRALGTEHDDTVRRLLGAHGPTIDADHIAAQLGIEAAADVVVVGFAPVDAVGSGAAELAGPDTVSALTLHASTFRVDSVTAILDGRAYVVLPGVTGASAIRWARPVVAATRAQFGMTVRAVVAGPDGGLAAVPELRAQVDRVLDAATGSGELIDEVTTVEHSRSGVLLGEILTYIDDHPELVDDRVVELVQHDTKTGGALAESLLAYLDGFGDVRAVATAMHIHPNTLRYRIRRVQELTGMDLTDPATRLVVALALRAHGTG